MNASFSRPDPDQSIPDGLGPPTPPSQQDPDPVFQVIRIVILAAGGFLLAWYGQWQAARWFIKVIPSRWIDALGGYSVFLLLALLAVAGSLGAFVLLQGGAALWRRASRRFAAAGRASRLAMGLAALAGALTLAALAVLGITLLQREPAPRLDFSHAAARELVDQEAGRYDELLLSGIPPSPAAAARLRAADVAYGARHYSEAARAYRKAYGMRFRDVLSQASGTERLKGFSLAYAQLVADDLQASAAWLRAALQADSSSSMPFYLQGHIHRQQGYLESAATTFERCWERDRRNAGCALSRASTLALREDWPAARDAFYDALRRDVFATAIVDYAELLEAVDSLNRRIRREPGEVPAHVVRGLALRYLVVYDPAKIPEADAAAQELLRLQPEHPDGLITLGANARKRQDLAAAEGFFRRAVNADRNHAYGWWLLANILEQQNRLEEMAEANALAATLDPRKPEYLLSYADALHRTGRIGEMATVSEQAVRLDPRNPEAWHSLGDAFAEQGWREEAMGAYASALRLEPTNWRLHYNMGNELSKAGRHQEAVPYFEAAVREGGDARAIARLGRSLWKSGRLTEALQVFEDGIRQYPDDAQLHAGLGDTYLEMGRTDDADREHARGDELEKAQKVPE